MSEQNYRDYLVWDDPTTQVFDMYTQAKKQILQDSQNVEKGERI